MTSLGVILHSELEYQLPRPSSLLADSAALAISFPSSFTPIFSCFLVTDSQSAVRTGGVSCSPVLPSARGFANVVEHVLQSLSRSSLPFPLYEFFYSGAIDTFDSSCASATSLFTNVLGDASSFRSIFTPATIFACSLVFVSHSIVALDRQRGQLHPPTKASRRQSCSVCTKMPNDASSEK